MGNRREKIEWLQKMRKKYKDEDDLIREFCMIFASTKRTAIEILDIIK